MSRHMREPDLGAVVITIVSPTRMVLVKDTSFPDARWKCPGGGIEKDDGGIIGAAIREAFEETGIPLRPEEVEFVSEHQRVNGVYSPHLCVARVDEEKIDARARVGSENGRRIRVADFPRDEVPVMLDLLERHRPFVRKVEGMG